LEHPYLRPHVFIEEAPIQKPEEPSNQSEEQPDLEESGEEQSKT
jgi:hypothetical protein